MHNNKYDLKEEERTRCEVWTRVMGYHRPVSQFNPGKQGEHGERLYYRQAGPSGAGSAATPLASR